MAKSKDVKKATKATEAPATKSKAIAKELAVKATTKTANGKKSKKPPTPEPESDSDDDDSSEESESSEDSDSESESEAEEKKPAAKTNGTAKKVAAKEESSDDSDSESESEEEKPVTKKAAVNGAAKAATADSSDSESDSDESESSDSSDEDTPMKDAKPAAEDEDSDSDDSESSESSESDSSESEEAEAPTKKRKADDESAAAGKKIKKETATDETANVGSKNLFVGSLSWNVNDEWLYQAFQEFGEIVGARVVTDRDSGRSKGFGYVEFSNAADAAKALKAMLGTEIDGRKINVDLATPRDNAEPKQKAQDRAAKFGDAPNAESDTLFVGNVAWEVDENILGEAFGAHGSIKNVRLPTDMESGKMKGFGYVTFASVEDAKAAYEAMVGAEIGGRVVRLDYATPRAQNGDSSRGGGRGGFGGRGGARGGARGGGRGGFGGRGGARGGRGGSTNRGGFGDFKGKKMTF